KNEGIIDVVVDPTPHPADSEENRNPFTLFQRLLIVVSSALGLAWILNDPVSKISEDRMNLFDFSLFGLSGPNVIILLALALFIFFAFVTMFFWAIFEQSASSLTVFARDYTQRTLAGNAGLTFKIVNSLMTIVPLGVITWVLVMLFKKTFAKYALSNIFLSLSF